VTRVNIKSASRAAVPHVRAQRSHQQTVLWNARAVELCPRAPRCAAAACALHIRSTLALQLCRLPARDAAVLRLRLGDLLLMAAAAGLVPLSVRLVLLWRPGEAARVGM
jgi:hypothetical protein